MALHECPVCGSEILIEEDACPKCGYRADEMNPESKSEQPEPASKPGRPKPSKNKKIIAAVIAIIAVVIIGGILWFGPNYLSSDEKSAVQNVTAQIDKIGEVTLNSAALINKADKDFNALNSKSQKHVENQSKLLQAKETLANLQISNVEEAIDKIGDVSLDSGAALSSIRQLYENLTPDQQPKITNYETLTDAEAQFATLFMDNTTSLINAIGKVTLNSEDAIKAAEDAFSKLNNDEQVKITNASVLTDARKTFNALKKEAADQFALLKPGKIVKSADWQLTYKDKSLTNALYPDNTDDAYKIYLAPDKQLFVDAVFTVKNLSSEALLLNTIVSEYKVTYDLKTYTAYKCFISAGDTIVPIIDTDTLDAKKTVTFHVSVAVPIAAKNTDLPIQIGLTILGEKHTINFR